MPKPPDTTPEGPVGDGERAPLNQAELRDLREKLTPRADNYEHIARLIATVDKLRAHLPDQEHNEQAIRVLQAKLATAEATLEQALAERERLREALERIAAMPNGGVPGHAVAVGCRHNIVAWKALNAPDEHECEKCDGRGFTTDWGPHLDWPGYEGKEVSYGKQIPCDCNDGWIAAAGTKDGEGADDDFYEEDEPVEELIAAFEAGEKGVTAPPEDWQTASNAYELAHTNAWTWNPLTGHMEPMRSNGEISATRDNASRAMGVSRMSIATTHNPRRTSDERKQRARSNGSRRMQSRSTAPRKPPGRRKPSHGCRSHAPLWTYKPLTRHAATCTNRRSPIAYSTKPTNLLGILSIPLGLVTDTDSLSIKCVTRSFSCG